MADCRELPEQEKRVETGVVRFGADWPGIFIRGDNAIFYAAVLERVLALCEKHNPPSVLLGVRRLPELLRSCDLRSGWPPDERGGD